MEGKPGRICVIRICVARVLLRLTKSNVYSSYKSVVSNVAVALCRSDMFNKLKYCVVKIVFEVVD